MRAPLGYHVDHPLGGVGDAKHPDGLVGRVEDWCELAAVRMRTPFVSNVDHPLGGVYRAKQTDGLVGLVEGWAE